MIRYLNVTDPSNCPIPWWDKVEALQKPRKFQFNPGLNILWGRNGSGKSTVIKLMARLAHCEQGGVPVVTTHSLQELFTTIGFGGENKRAKLKKAVKFSHDGQGIRHFDPNHAVGLIGGMAGFDYDFGMEGMQNAMFKGSAGQTTEFRIGKLLKAIIDKDVPKVEYKVHEGRVNSLWSERLQIANAFLKGRGKKGQPTILLDEPERSLDLPMQMAMWRFIREHAKETQLIVASHSFFALRIPGANYIELTEGYLKQSLGVLDVLNSWEEDDALLALLRKRSKEK